MQKQDIINYLNTKDKHITENLFNKAKQIRNEFIGKYVYFRGIIELSNICIKDCYYCGIRKSNNNIKRYLMTENEIVDSAVWAFKNNYGSIVLQAGENTNVKYIEFIENLIKKIKNSTQQNFGITLSLGEQNYSTYERWYKAGAHRYLLRIETSNKELYQKLHPNDHDFDQRLQCLKNLNQIGYQTGTGVMIGLPFQTIEHLADDILFFQNFEVDMLGMGPYIVHSETPLYTQTDNSEEEKQHRLNLALKMIALCRIIMPDINIAATTALQALDNLGREKALNAGANIIMPIITQKTYRSHYLLYENKPCIDDSPEECKNCLELRIKSCGLNIGYSQLGDSPHAIKQGR